MMFIILLLLVSVTQVTSRVQRVQVCEGARPDGRTLSCHSGHVLNIVTALYGRRSLRICRRGSRWWSRNCGSSSSFNKVKQLCNGKKHCYLRASNSMFGDPCWGVNKYLDVSYECVKDNRLVPHGTTFQICEHARPDGRQLSCPQVYQTINIVSALYGRKSLSICGHGRHWGFNTCGTSASFDKAKQICNGKKKCYLRASNLMFGDPCRGVEKYLDVNFECTGINPDLLPAFVGNWRLEYSNAHEDTYTVAPDGEVTLGISRRSAYLQESDNQVDFPSSEGWFKVSKIFRDAVWEYLRLKGDGTMEIHHFCSDRCGGKYKHSNNYCCLGSGLQIATQNRHTQTYEVYVKTSNKLHAGTDANVFIIIYGEDGDTGKLYFRKSETNTDAFEWNNVDKFTVQAMDVGKITMMRIGHDNQGVNAGWHLNNVVVTVGSCTSTFSVWKWLYSARREIDVYPTLQVGECGGSHSVANPTTRSVTDARTPVSTGSICRRDYRKIGCFSRDWKNVPDLIITDLDSTHPNYTKSMNWDNYAEGLHSLACRCRAKTVGKYKYFGIGFLGECVAGKDHRSLKELFQARNGGEAQGCVNGDWGSCIRQHETECTGNADYDFFYEIVE